MKAAPVAESLLFAESAIAQAANDLLERYIRDRAQVRRGTREQRRLTNESAATYRSMWRLLTVYLDVARIPVESVTPRDLLDYFAYGKPPIDGAGGGQAHRTKRSPPLTLRYQWRLLALADRVLRFHAQRAGTEPNTAAADLLADDPYRFVNTPEHDPRMDVLTEADVVQVVRYATRVARAARGRQKIAAPVAWKELRDCAAIALHLGAGLTPSEVRELLAADVVSGASTRSAGAWKVYVRATRSSEARDAPLAGWAARILQNWLSVRRALVARAAARAQETGEFLLPGTSSGGAWSKPSHRICCVDVLRAAGVVDPEGGVLKLRHTYAVRELTVKRRRPNDVRRWLGLATMAQIERYQQRMLEPPKPR